MPDAMYLADVERSRPALWPACLSVAVHINALRFGTVIHRQTVSVSARPAALRSSPAFFDDRVHSSPASLFTRCPADSTIWKVAVSRRSLNATIFSITRAGLLSSCAPAIRQQAAGDAMLVLAPVEGDKRLQKRLAIGRLRDARHGGDFVAPTIFDRFGVCRRPLGPSLPDGLSRARSCGGRQIGRRRALVTSVSRATASRLVAASACHHRLYFNNRRRPATAAGAHGGDQNQRRRQRGAGGGSPSHAARSGRPTRWTGRRSAITADASQRRGARRALVTPPRRIAMTSRISPASPATNSHTDRRRRRSRHRCAWVSAAEFRRRHVR